MSSPVVPGAAVVLEEPWESAPLELELPGSPVVGAVMAPVLPAGPLLPPVAPPLDSLAPSELVPPSFLKQPTRPTLTTRAAARARGGEERGRRGVDAAVVLEHELPGVDGDPRAMQMQRHRDPHPIGVDRQRSEVARAVEALEPAGVGAIEYEVHTGELEVA